MLGGGYLALLRIAPDLGRLPTARLLRWLRTFVLSDSPQQPGSVFGEPYTEVGHCLISLVLATVGGIVAHFLFGELAGGATVREPATSSGPRTKSTWLFIASIIGGVGFLLALCATFVALGLRSGVWTAVACFLIWALLGLAAIGAVLGQGPKRGSGGAAVFGIGYSVVMARGGGETTSWPCATVDWTLIGIRDLFPSARAEFPPVTVASYAANERLHQALDRPITLHFPHETPLEDVLNTIRSATKGSTGGSVQIHVDPLGLQEADKTLTSPITIDLENVRLGTCLRLALRQLGLDYMLKDGVLVITLAEEILHTTPQDAFLTVGHCLLAWLAAVLGGALVPLVNRQGSENR